METCPLHADPYELTNLAPDPTYADVLHEMVAWMWHRIHEADDSNMVNSHYGMFRHAPVRPRAG